MVINIPADICDDPLAKFRDEIVSQGSRYREQSCYRDHRQKILVDILGFVLVEPQVNHAAQRNGHQKGEEGCRYQSQTSRKGLPAVRHKEWQQPS